MEADEEDMLLLPINVGHECQILMQNGEYLRQCRQTAFDRWIRSWQIHYAQHLPPEAWHRSHSQWNGWHSVLSEWNTCCYRWALLDCLTDSVQANCPLAATFDLRSFLRKRDEVIHYYESFQCQNYPFGTMQCYLSNWLVMLITLAVLLLLTLTGALGYYYYRQRTHPFTHNHTDNITDL